MPSLARRIKSAAAAPARIPLMQEQVFSVPYTLPSGRVVHLRGKFDSVDLIDAHEDYPKGDGEEARTGEDW